MMKKNTFAKVDSSLYSETLDNGIEVYLYPKNDTKNFYISISVKYGAKINQYKKGNKIVDVIPGSAHFLEHKVMALSENAEISKRINELGSIANAWTSYECTNYNIFGSINIKENLKLVFDIFYNTNINEKSVEEEKGIIGEEIDMNQDDINTYLYYRMFDNLFNNSYVKNTIVGTRESISKITAKSLNEIYDDYYIPNNTFIIVCGDFNVEDIMNEIKEYMSKLNLKQKELPEKIVKKESDIVSNSFEIIHKDLESERVKFALKIPKKNFNFKNDTFLKYYINIILSCNFSSTAQLYEKYKNAGIIYSMSTTTSVIDDYVVVFISANCKDGDTFIENIKKDIKKLKLSEIDFERKKKMFIKSYIIDFDNIEDIEYNICDMLVRDNKINYNEYTEILNMSYDQAKKIQEEIKPINTSIIKAIK